MPVALEQFVKQLADSGVIAPGKLENFIPPKAAPKDAQELARQLVQSKHLTKFQAQEIYAGRAKSLILGNYTILDKIGAGGMGQVFKAEHRRMHRLVAIKMLPAATMKDAAAVARFQREVEAAAKLRHSNIVATDDADEANGVHFLVMEYAEGSDLSALVKKNGPLPVPKAVNYILQAARGLEFAHGEAVVHRDIKPANLLLDKKGTVKILDMGLARIDSDGDAATQAELTGTGAILGTVDYMAPEQALSTKHVDGRADIYSLGCSLYYLLTAHAAYDGDSLMAKLLAHREQPIPSLGDEVPEEVQAVFQKMVAKKVQDRYQTMSEVVAALEQCNSGQQSSVSLQQSVSTNPDPDALTFLRDIPAHTTHKPKPKSTAKPIKDVVSAKTGNRKRKLILGAVGAGFLGIAILAAVIFKLRTQDGTLVIEINQPDAVVQVLDADGKVEISQPGEKGMVSISVDPGKHRLKVEKDGFQFFAKDFEMESGGTAMMKANLVEDKPWFKPAFLEWQREVTYLPAEQQVQAVAKKLQKLNPGFDGLVTHKIEVGAVTELDFLADNVTDISPVRALQRLTILHCGGGGAYTFESHGRLSDLSPLKGMPLKELKCNRTPVSDLSSLAGMHLTLLDCGWSQVSDLSPLKGMLLIHFACDHTRVSDLSSIKGMRLADLWCGTTTISDLSALRGMPLTELHCDRMPVSDLSPLAGMPLDSLDCLGTLVPDLSPLEGCQSLKLLGVKNTKVTAAGVATLQKALPNCKIEWDGSVKAIAPIKPITNINDPAFQQWMKSVAALPAEKQVEAVAKKLQEFNPGFDGKESHTTDGGAVTGLDVATDDVIDLSPVRALVRLKYLRLTGGSTRTGKLTDLSPLQGLPLTDLILDANKQLSDLSSLRGLPLTRLSLDETSATNLTPLRGMKLADFNADLTPLVDISPLAGMPLKVLTLSHSRVSDLSPLRGMKLAMLKIGGTQVTDLSALDGMPIETLFCHETSISDLSPLKGMQIAKLTCHTTKVSDLTPLRGMPLVHLLIDRSPVSDLNPLEGMNLTVFVFTPKDVTKGIDVLRRMKSVQNIGVRWDIVFPPNEFWKKYDAGEFGKPATAAAPPDRKPITNINDPAFQQWMKTVASLPAEAQVDAVVKKLQELNPGYDGKVTGGYEEAKPKIDNGVVTSFGFVLDNVTDISPVRALAGLKVLSCAGSSFSKGRLSDLAPLHEMPLTMLQCSYTQVSDLSPLRGMKLTLLGCDQTQVSDLSPLEGMPLTWFECGGTRVFDLSSLAGMKLTWLGCTHTRVFDLEPLRGMPLITLNCSGTQVSDVSPLQNCRSLTSLSVAKSKVAATSVAALQKALPKCKIDWDGASNPDLAWNKPAFQQWMKTVAALPAEQQVQAVVKKLQELNPGFDGKETHKIEGGVVTGLGFFTDNVTDISPVRALTGLKKLSCVSNIWDAPKRVATLSDLSPLRGMKLTKFDCRCTNVSDLSPLQGMKLTELGCQATPVSNLLPLKDMPVTTLWCHDTRVSDLSPLKGLPLTTLLCSNTPISDLSPLTGMPLTRLGCFYTHVSDLSPLQGMNLSDLAISPKNIAKGMDVIRQMKSLSSIGIDGTNKWSPAEFWKKYDAGEFGK